jgi:hypothetical protein
MKRRARRRPFIGPVRDPLCLWFLEYADARGVWRRYYANRDEARAALRDLKQGGDSRGYSRGMAG